MSGYEILLMLYSQIETSRQVKIPKNITFTQLHLLIQKLFNFDDYHNFEFQIPNQSADEDTVDLNDVKQTIDYTESDNIRISEVFDENKVALYVYDFGDNWEIVISKLEDIDYDNVTALITDYKGKYSPMDDIGGVFVFEEIMEAVGEGDDEDIKYILEDYGLKKGDLTKMDFEKKYKIGSRVRLM